MEIFKKVFPEKQKFLKSNESTETTPSEKTTEKNVDENMQVDVDPNNNQPVQNTAPESSAKLTPSFYESTLAYPEIVSAFPNRANVRLIKNLAYGRSGELSAILTYIFQKVLLPDDFENFKSDLEQIAIVGIKHYNALSTAVVAFGGIPTLTDGRGNVWTGRNIDTAIDPRKMIINNIQREEKAIDEYVRASKQTENESLLQLFLKIEEDKKLHLEIFKNLADKIE